MKVKDLIQKFKDAGYDEETDICFFNWEYKGSLQWFNIQSVNRNVDVDDPKNEIGIYLKKCDFKDYNK